MSEDNQIAVDLTQEIVVPVLNRDAVDGKKTARVRWPNNQQWAEWSNTLYLETVMRPGDTGTRSEVVGREKATQVLYRGIVVEESEPLDIYEQQEVIERISSHRVTDFRLDGSVLTVDLRVCGGGVTTHHIHMPTARERQDYDRALPDSVSQGRGRSLRSMADTAQVNFYDRLFIKADGYKGPVPNPHKHAVIVLLMQVLQEIDEDPDFQTTAKG